MLRRISFLFIATLFSVFTYAQRFGYVDTEYVLSKIPEYGQAQRELDAMSQKWQGEIEAIQSEIDALTQAYQAEKILLTEEMRAEREGVIEAKKKMVRDLQFQHFGPEGDLFKKRIELVKPIQDQIYTAIKEVAKKKKLDFVFDKAGSVSMLYANEDNDISEDVIKKIGY